MDAVEATLLQAIRDRPDDDAPRLVYADWLGDRGDPRGELIAVQCALARLARDVDERPALEARDRELRALHEPAWLGGVSELPGFGRGDLSRGFVGRVVFAEGALPGQATALFAAAPVLTDLFLTDKRVSNDRHVPPELAQVRSICFASTDYALACVASPHAASLARIELARECDGAKVLAAVIRADLAALRTLDVGMTRIGYDGLAALLGWPGLARLRHLDVRGCALDGRIVALAASPEVTGLERLDVQYNPIAEPAAIAILTSRRLGSLAMLDLSDTGARGALAHTTLTGLRRIRYDKNELAADAARRVAGCAALGGLEELSLGGRNVDAPSTVDAEGAAAIVASTALARLTTIDLQQNFFGAGAALVASAFRPGFRSIDLDYTRLDERAAEALAANPALASVTRLNLGNTGLGPAGYEALAASPYLRPRVLDLRYTRPGVKGLKALARSAILSEVRCLELGSCDLDIKAIRALAGATQLTRLTRLNLHGNKLGDAAAAALAESRTLPRLAELNVRYTSIGEDGARLLREAGHVVHAAG